jgi:hypothetical protein
MTSERQFHVGQILWYVPADMRWSKPREVTITKIGRKWITLGNFGRIDIKTLHVDAGAYSSPGRCYLSQEDYETERSADAAWHELREAIGRLYRRPSNLPISAIRQAAALLGIEIEDDR